MIEDEFGEGITSQFNLEDILYMDFELIEEQQDIDIQAIEEFIIPDNVSERIVNEVNIINLFEKQNKLIQAIKQLDRKINKE